MPSPFPETIGRFRVESILGSGGMGEVYKAIDPTLRRTVAVKTVRPDISNPDYLGRLLREAQACASLHHPHIVTVYEAGEIDGAVYIVMEYLEGEDLAQVLERGTLTFEQRIRTLMQILDALEHAHSKGVIHRDIKPGNVRRLPDGTIKLVDFGLARMVRAETLTATGMVKGTPHYASPEQLRGEPVDRRTDIYSAGTMGYEMCSGRRPFEGDHDSLATIILKVVSEPPPPMDVSWSRNFPEMERIITRAMAKSREDRYQSAEDMKNAFAAFLGASRDLVASAQAQESVSAQMTVIEARTLIASGKAADAHTLLSQTLKASPYAAGVRQFLAEMSTVASNPVTPAAPVTPTSPMPSTVSPIDEATLAVRASALAETQLDDGSAAARTAISFTPPPTAMTSPVPVVKKPSRALWLGGGIAAAAVIAVAVIGLPLGTNLVSPETVAANGSGASAGTPPIVDAKVTTPTPPAPDATRVAETTPAAPAPAAKGLSPAPPPLAAAATVPPSAVVPVSLKDGGAKKLFYGDGKPGAPGAAAARPTGLRYRMTQQSGGTEVDVDPATAVFRNGDKVRLSFESNIDGFLYVVTEGSSGRWAVLFPHPDSNGGMNRIRHSEEYIVPPDGWFRFDGDPGTEKVFVVLSKEPLSQLPGFEKPVTKAESLNASLVESVQQSIRSRDLTFERDTRAQTQGGKIIQASYVVNRAELGKSVAVSISLNHGQ